MQWRRWMERQHCSIPFFFNPCRHEQRTKQRIDPLMPRELQHLNTRKWRICTPLCPHSCLGCNQQKSTSWSVDSYLDSFIDSMSVCAVHPSRKVKKTVVFTLAPSNTASTTWEVYSQRLFWSKTQLHEMIPYLIVWVTLGKLCSVTSCVTPAKSCLHFWLSGHTRFWNPSVKVICHCSF